MVAQNTEIIREGFAQNTETLKILIGKKEIKEKNASKLTTNDLNAFNTISPAADTILSDNLVLDPQVLRICCDFIRKYTEDSIQLKFEKKKLMKTFMFNPDH